MAKFKKPLRIVLDTNIILSAFSRKSPYRIIIDKLLEGSYDAFISTEMLLEYEEKLNEFFDEKTTQLFLDALELLPNIHKINVFYKFLLIAADADDDKFADCAIAAGVHFLVSDDKHYKVLLKLGFPKVNLIRIHDFVKILEAI
jgi:uncharacterized protein